MKKQILTLMVSAAVVATNPAFGMEDDGNMPKGTPHQVPSETGDEKTLEKLQSAQRFIEITFKATFLPRYDEMTLKELKECLKKEQAHNKVLYARPDGPERFLDPQPGLHDHLIVSIEKIALLHRLIEEKEKN